MSEPTTMQINDVEYVRKDSIQTPASNNDGLPYVIIRGRDSGVHAGYLESKEGSEVTLVNSRRLWYWDGASTLSQLSTEGVSKPENCKFACVIQEITILGVCEIIAATEAARLNIEQVSAWKA